MPTVKTENYTAQMTQEIVSAYQGAGTDMTAEGHQARADVVKEQADKHGKSERSIRSKLVTQKVYIKKAEKSKVTGETPEKKDAIAVNVVNAFGVEMIEVDGEMKAHRLSADSLAKMNKTDLAILFHRFNSEVLAMAETDEIETPDENDSQEGEAEAES